VQKIDERWELVKLWNTILEIQKTVILLLHQCQPVARKTVDSFPAM
jgi:hypothetical protein